MFLRGCQVAYSDILSPEVLEPAIWKSLLAMEGQAALMAPVALVNGGNLRNSITIKTDSNEKQHGSSPDGLAYKPTTYEGVIGTAAEYGAAVEFGRPDIPAYPAQPYLRPALDWFRAKIGQITGGELKKQMELYSNRHPHLRTRSQSEILAGINN
jgi:phage gpG-like protein